MLLIVIYFKAETYGYPIAHGKWSYGSAIDNWNEQDNVFWSTQSCMNEYIEWTYEQDMKVLQIVCHYFRVGSKTGFAIWVTCTGQRIRLPR